MKSSTNKTKNGTAAQQQARDGPHLEFGSILLALDLTPGRRRAADAVSIPSPASENQLMKVQFHVRGLNLNDGSRHCLEQSPAYRAYFSLAVPGPDIHAEGRDHTLEAAWLKVTTSLRKQIEQRKSRQGVRATAAGRRGPKVKRKLARIQNGAFNAVFGAAH